MKNETKKIIAKETLILLSTLTLTFTFYLIIILNNTFQSYLNKKLTTELNEKKALLKSLENDISEYNDKNEKFKRKIFQQYGKIEFLPKLPKGVKIKEKIGIEDKWDKYIVDFIDLISWEKIKLKKEEEDLPILVDYDRFCNILKDSISLRKYIYEKLKSKYDDSECNNLSIFESKIGVIIPKKITELKIKSERLFTESEIINNQIKNTKNRIVEGPNVSKYSFCFFYTLFVFTFILRYLFLVVRWSISTLKS